MPRFMYFSFAAAHNEFIFSFTGQGIGIARELFINEIFLYDSSSYDKLSHRLIAMLT